MPDDETEELYEELEEQRRERRHSEEARRSRQLGRDFARIFGPSDPDINPRAIQFAVGDEPPQLDREKVVADPGDVVVLTGKYLTGVTTVKIDDSEVDQLTVSSEQIAFVVPPDDVRPGKLTLEWLSLDRSEHQKVQIDFDVKTKPETSERPGTYGRS